MDNNYKSALENFRNNRIAAAKPLLEATLEQEPTHLDAIYKIGVCDFRLKDFTSAAQQFRRVIELDPEHAQAWYYLGLTHERQGQDEQAIKHFRLSLNLDPKLEVARKKLELMTQPVGRQSESTAQPLGAPETFFNTTPEDGPGELLFASKRRRFGSFSIHSLLLMLIFLIVAVLGVLALTDYDRFFSRHFLTFAALGLLGIFFISLDLVPRSLLTKYYIYERRIDIQRGILFRKHVSIWIFEITNLTYTRNPIDLITRNATITIELQNAQHRLSGLCPPKTKNSTRSIKFASSLFEELRNTVREQRGSVKKVWI